MPVLIVGLVIALITAVGGGTVYASQDTVPGDALYQVKTTAEGSQITLAWSDEAKAQTYLDLAAKRLSEIQKASRAGNTAAADRAAEGFVQNMAQSDQHLQQAVASGRDVSRIIARLSENLDRQQQVLSTVAESGPEQSRAAIAKAGEKAAKGLTPASARIKRTPVAERSDGAQGTATRLPGTTGTPPANATAPGAQSTTLTQMISEVRKLAADPKVPGQSYNGLLAKLNAAQAALDRGQPKVAVNNLDAFLNELNALQRAGHISAENYEALYSSYSAMVRSLGGSPEAGVTPGSTPRSGKPEAKPGSGKPEATPGSGKPEAKPGARERQDG